MTDFPEIPDFLRREPEPGRTHHYRAREPRIVMPAERKRRLPFELPKTMDATAKALLREEIARRDAVKAARFAALRERSR